MSDSTSCSESPTHSASLSTSSSLRCAQLALMTLSWLVVPTPLTKSSSTPTASSAPSTKRPGATSSGIREPDGRPWRVKFHREVAKIIAKFGEDNVVFRPTIAQLQQQLEIDPKQFPKKKGQLRNARAAELAYAGVTWRAVFTLDEEGRVVKVLSLDAHDVAYERARRRV
jgi:hypothetical protein